MLHLHKYSVFNYKLWAMLLLTVLCFQGTKAQKPLKFSNTSAATTTVNTTLYSFAKDKTSIIPTIEYFIKDGIFDSKSNNIGYKLKLQNKIKEEQVGEIIMHICWWQCSYWKHRNLVATALLQIHIFFQNFLFS